MSERLFSRIDIEPRGRARMRLVLVMMLSAHVANGNKDGECRSLAGEVSGVSVERSVGQSKACESACYMMSVLRFGKLTGVE